LEKKYKDAAILIADQKRQGHWMVQEPAQVIEYRGPRQPPKMRGAESRTEVSRRRHRGIHIKEITDMDTNAAGYTEGQSVCRHPTNARDVGLAFTSVPITRHDAMFPPTDYPCRSFYQALDRYYGLSNWSRGNVGIEKLYSSKKHFVQQWTEYRLCFGPPVSFLEAVVVDSHEVCALEHLMSIMHNWHFGNGKLRYLDYFHDFVQCLEEMPTGIGCRRYFLRLLHRMGVYADSRCCNWKNTPQVHARCCGVYSKANGRHTSWCAFFPNEEINVDQLEEVTEYRRRMRVLVIEAKNVQENAEHTAEKRLDYSAARVALRTTGSVGLERRSWSYDANILAAAPYGR